MRPERRRAENEKALTELDEWCKPLSMHVVDNGYSLYLCVGRKQVANAWYKRPWKDKEGRSVAAAARDLSERISEGLYFTIRDSREYAVPGGGTVWEHREYSFTTPACSSPQELAVRLAAMGWRPPGDVWEMKLESPSEKKV